MKMAKALTITLAAAGLLAFTAAADAQTRGNRGGAGGGRPGAVAFNHRGGDHGRFFNNRGRVVVVRGGWGWGGWGWGWGPYWGYGWPYWYPYGYYAPPPYYYQGYQGQVYEGQPAPDYQRRRTNDGGKDTSSLTSRVQERLARDGYYRGPIDGVIGDGTRRAIRSYERDNGLPATGQIDRRLLQTMDLS